jgi:hypothetical protein
LIISFFALCPLKMKGFAMNKTATPLLRIDGSGAQQTLGLVVDGVRPGPTLLVTGFSATTVAIFDRIAALPTIRYLHGKLVLVHIDRLGTNTSGMDWLSEQIGIVDENLFLPLLADDRLSEDALNRGTDEDYWTILSKMASLGMISGRGVSSSRTVVQMAAWQF